MTTTPIPVSPPYRHHGHWRPVLVALAVLVLIVGAVGVALAVRANRTTHQTASGGGSNQNTRQPSGGSGGTTTTPSQTPTQQPSQITQPAVASGLPAQASDAVRTASVSSTPYCGIRWGSLPKSTGTLSAAPVVDVRAGQHVCYDRLVIDVAGKAGGYRVQYVSNVTAQGSGTVIPVAGGARLQVTVRDPSHDPVKLLTYYLPKDSSDVVPVTGYRAFRQVAWAGSYEGYTSFGLGVRARLPFRVFVLAGPGNHSRIVIDVAHRW